MQLLHLINNKQKKNILCSSQNNYAVICLFQYNQTPLHYASKRGHSEVVQVLLSHGATVNMKDEVSYKELVFRYYD